MLSTQLHPGKNILYPLYHSRRIRYVVGLSSIFFLMFLMLRGIFYFGFSDVGESGTLELNTLLTALYIGVKFDLRLALLLCLPVFVLASIPGFNLTTSRWLRLLINGYLILAAVLVLLFYIVDFGHYVYLGSRIDSTVLRFASDTGISTRMVWESYPVVWITLGWVAGVALVAAAAIALGRRTVAARRQAAPKKWQVGVAMFSLLVAMVALMFGRISSVPLRWNHAFFSGESSVAALGLNPVLYFFDTYGNREIPYDENKVREYYPVVADYLGVEQRDEVRLNYDRYQPVKDHAVVGPGERKPNIIFVMLESLGASRVGIYGNPLKPTPNLDRLAETGIWAPHFYVPVSGTARTVFASITGIPDVTKDSTASRNPLITDQRVIMNAFTDYQKYYFIGGSAGWANMSAFIQNSIQDLQLYEEKAYNEPIVDVWGISDLSLIKEFNRFIGERDKSRPFITVLQTAGNHRPFTIPEQNDGFETVTVSEEELHRWGFKNIEQFNAVRLLDFNIGRMIDLAKENGYYEDTIFIFYGDHNNRITQTPHMAAFHEKVKLDLDGVHVPFIIHAPKYLQPGKLDGAYSLLDVMPTAASLVGIEYVNTTMGRDMFSPAPEGERAVYVQGKEANSLSVGMITENFAVRMLDDGSHLSLHELHSETPEKDVQAQYPEKFASMSKLLKGFFETSRFQFYHNRRSEAQKRQAATSVKPVPYQDKYGQRD